MTQKTPEQFYKRLRKNRKYLPKWKKLSGADIRRVEKIAQQTYNMECCMAGDIYAKHKGKE